MNLTIVAATGGNEAVLSGLGARSTGDLSATRRISDGAGHPDAVEGVALLDIIPTTDVFARADARFALAYWPWSLLAQPAPLPETLFGAAPEGIVDTAQGQWGWDSSIFPPMCAGNT